MLLFAEGLLTSFDDREGFLFWSLVCFCMALFGASHKSMCFILGQEVHTLYMLFVVENELWMVRNVAANPPAL